MFIFVKLQVFDAGEKLFISLVEKNRWADDASTAVEEKEGEGGGEGGKRIPRSRKVVVRDDYVDNGGDDIFLVDREFAVGPRVCRGVAWHSICPRILTTPEEPLHHGK